MPSSSESGLLGVGDGVAAVESAEIDSSAISFLPTSPMNLACCAVAFLSRISEEDDKRRAVVRVIERRIMVGSCRVMSCVMSNVVDVAPHFSSLPESVDSSK